MSVRFYLIPIVVDSGIRLPEYLKWPRLPNRVPLITADWAMKDFGLEPTALVAVDVTAAEHSTLAAQADVTVIPANIDNNVGANLATVQAALENLHIPGDAITAGTTYRQIIRGIIAIFSVAQQFDGLQGGQIFPAGITLSTQLSDLSANVRQKLQQAATNLGYSYDGITLASTLRDVLKALANQQAPQSMLGVDI